MFRVMVVNAKGGSGKTTLSTNIAGYYAEQGYHTALMDYDPQESAMAWHAMRPRTAAPIHAISANRHVTGATRSWRLRIPPETQRVVIDVPAGFTGYDLQNMLRRVDAVIIPVLPSPIDIHVTSDFIKDLFLTGKIRAMPVEVGVIANRVKKDTPVYHPLQRFLKRLEIPFITTLWDSPSYTDAAERGLSIHELNGVDPSELHQWEPLQEWLAAAEAKAESQEPPPIPRTTTSRW
jgi:chromosome partitioning protein